MERLAGKVIFLTGAGRGMGRAMALGFAREGARLALCARTVHELEATAKEAEALGAQVVASPADVRDAEAIKRLVDQTVDTFGRIDVLVNNAAIGMPVVPSNQRQLKDVPTACLTDMFITNVVGALHCLQAVVPVMISQGAGSIVNIQTGQALTCRPGMGPYGVSKAGLEPMVQALGEELKPHNIAVNSLNPGGAVDTAMMGDAPPERRAAALRPEIIVEPAITLALQDASGITGRSLSALDFPWPGIAAAGAPARG